MEVPAVCCTSGSQSRRMGLRPPVIKSESEMGGIGKRNMKFAEYKGYSCVILLYSCVTGIERPCVHCSEIGWENHFHCRTICSFQGRIDELVYHKNNLLHGRIHSNGYGHLIRVNRKEGLREIALIDSSKKKQM